MRIESIIRLMDALEFITMVARLVLQIFSIGKHFSHFFSQCE